MKTIPAAVLAEIASFKRKKAKIGANAGLIKNTVEAVEADVTSIAKK
jgi:predicted ribonuclease YlaK